MCTMVFITTIIMICNFYRTQGVYVQYTYMYMLCIVINLIGAAFKAGALRFSIALIKQRHRGIYQISLQNPVEPR